jgi:hypothetical protein
MSHRRSAEIEIEQALTCPIDVAALFKVESPARFESLERLWREIVTRHAVDQEDMYLDDSPWSFLLGRISDDSLHAIQKNVCTWRDKARDEFLARVRRFTHLRYATREEYGKHLPPRGQRQTASWIEEMSSHGPSLFYHEVSPELMLRTFLNGIFSHFDVEESGHIRDEEIWNELLTADQCRVAFLCANQIGAAYGLPTRFLVFDFDALTPILHAYPVSEQEAHAIQGACSIIRTV